MRLGGAGEELRDCRVWLAGERLWLTCIWKQGGLGAHRIVQGGSAESCIGALGRGWLGERIIASIKCSYRDLLCEGNSKYLFSNLVRVFIMVHAEIMN